MRYERPNALIHTELTTFNRSVAVEVEDAVVQLNQEILDLR